jgi:Transposase DDE domain
MTNGGVTTHLDWLEVERMLPDGWRELAKEQKLVRKLPAHMGTKVSDISQVLRLILFMVATNSALLVSTATFAAAGLVKLSSVSLHQWMRKLGPYLAELVARMVAHEHAKFAPERWAGYVPILVDASAVMNPGAKGTTARVHKAIRLTDLRVVDVQVTDVTGGETFRRFHPSEGELWIGDRGYANPPGVAHVVASAAAVLVRYTRGTLPLYDARGTRIDVLHKLSKLPKASRPREWQAFVHAEGVKIQGRLCALRLPKDKAEQARARARKEQGASVTKETLEMAQFVAVFTTVQRDELTCDLILHLYRLRWQVELEFKRDKSITGLDRLPNFRPDTIETWIYTKLLLHQIARKLAASVGDFPPSAIAAAAVRGHDNSAQLRSPARCLGRTTVAAHEDALDAPCPRTTPRVAHLHN